MTNAPTPAGLAEETVRAAFQHFMHDAEFPCSASAMREAINLALAAQPSAGAEPVALTLFCPVCSLPHVDEGEWATRQHRTHQCQGCGHEWRPFPFATVGVTHPDPVHAASEAEDGAAELLREAGKQFRIYEAHHRAKKTNESYERAEVNARLAERIEASLATREEAPAEAGEDAAWTWLNGHVECDPADRDYSADEMVDAFMAGQSSALRAQPQARSGEGQ